MELEALSHGYKSIAAGCGLSGVRFHNLRHMHASLLLTSRIPIHVALARMGHEGIQTTVDTYGHVLPASDVEAEWTLENQLAAPFAKCLQTKRQTQEAGKSIYKPKWRNGRRAGLKNRWGKPRVSSNLTFGTTNTFPIYRASNSSLLTT